jgi:hypothetical protein
MGLEALTGIQLSRSFFGFLPRVLVVNSQLYKGYFICGSQ